MPLCGKCKTEIEVDEEIFICPDCGTEFHDRCHNLSRGLCPLCTLCGVNPMKQIEMLQFVDKSQPTSLDPKGRELGFEQIVVDGDPNIEFEQVTTEEQIGRINKAIETSPRALVSTSPAAKGKEWFVAFPALICAYFAWQGLAYGDTVAITIAVVIALGAAIWWSKT